MRDDEGQSPLDIVSENMYEDGRFDLVVYLISHGCGDDTERAIVLAQACCQGRLDVVKELVEQHKVDPKGERVCCSTQCITFHCLFVISGVRDVRSPLYLACVGGHKDMVEYLVEKANCDASE